MVTKRERIEYYDLRISIEPNEEKPFYLTGEDPSFNVVIENTTSRTQRGKIYVRWRLARVMSPREVEFELHPSATERYELPREWFYREGTAIYELVIMPEPPEQYTNISKNEIFLRGRGRGIHPLCSYYVRDKDLHKYEEGHKKTIVRSSRITIGLTALNVALFIIYLIRIFFIVNGA